MDAAIRQGQAWKCLRSLRITVPGFFGFFLLKNPHAHKILRFRGGCWGFLEGGVEVAILFLWARGFF